MLRVFWPAQVESELGPGQYSLPSAIGAVRASVAPFGSKSVRLPVRSPGSSAKPGERVETAAERLGLDPNDIPPRRNVQPRYVSHQRKTTFISSAARLGGDPGNGFRGRGFFRVWMV